MFEMRFCTTETIIEITENNFSSFENTIKLVILKQVYNYNFRNNHTKNHTNYSNFSEDNNNYKTDKINSLHKIYQ